MITWSVIRRKPNSRVMLETGMLILLCYKLDTLS